MKVVFFFLGNTNQNSFNFYFFKIYDIFGRSLNFMVCMLKTKTDPITKNFTFNNQEPANTPINQNRLTKYY